MPDYVQNTQASYDKVAGEYARHLMDELDHKPMERDLLKTFAQKVSGRVCDLGCGPGHVARYLHEHGADVFGIDLSQGMVDLARQHNPALTFEQGDMRALKLEDNSLGAIAALYSIIHIPRGEVVAVLKELRRVLKPGGTLLVGFHRGEDGLHRDEMWGEAVNLDFTFFETQEMVGYLKDAGFKVDEYIERDPYPEVEYPSKRAYVLASK